MVRFSSRTELPAATGDEYTPASAPSDDGDMAPPLVTDEHEVTMSGDLEQMTLTDIFQTLAVSKMEGVLVVCNPLEQRGLYFRDGNVNDLVFARPAHRRLGEQLVNAGLITPEQLQLALAAQGSSSRPLGEILVEQASIAREDLEDMALYQATEDLQSLFTWTHGTFEFFKGKPLNPRVVARLEAVPEFAVDGVLLEAARRSDEWDELLVSLHSVDEILTPTGAAPSVELDEGELTVMEVIDGTRSIRELTDWTSFGVFHIAKVCHALVTAGLVEAVESPELLQIAEQQRAHGETRRAMVTLRTLFARPDHCLGLEETRRLAAAMAACGDWRYGGRCLWAAAQREDNSGHAVDLLREACRIDTRSSYLLRALIEALMEHGGDEQELIDVTSRLADALIEENDEESALAEIERLEAACEDRTAVLGRKARVMQRLGETSAAVAALDELAEVLRADGNKVQLARVYEQILMFAPQRKDIARALTRLRMTRRSRQYRMAAAAAVVIAALIGGYTYYDHQARAARLQTVVAELLPVIDAGQLGRANSMIAAATAEFGQLQVFDEMRARIKQHQDRERSRKAQARDEQLRDQLAGAADHIERQRLSEALDIYATLMADSSARGQVTTVAANRVASIARELKRSASKLSALVPAAPDPVQTTAELKDTLVELQTSFEQAARALAQSVMEARHHPLLLDLMEQGALDELVQWAELTCETCELAASRELEYLASLERSETKRRLQSVFLAARMHDERHEWDAALAAYQQLVSEYPDEGELMDSFRDRVDQLTWITGRMRRQADATASGDHDAASRWLAELSERHPDLPFHELARLPLRVETNPPGAALHMDGQLIGQTPVSCSYPASGRAVFRVELDGFEPHEFTLGNDRGPARLGGRTQLTLTKEAAWTGAAVGSVQQQPVCDDRGHAYLVDRSGTVSCLDMDRGGAVVWRRDTDDLQGLLTRPVLCGDLVVIGSFDGTLRAIDRASGELRWATPGLPCEGAPTLFAAGLVVATSDQAVALIDPTNGEVVRRAELPGAVSAHVIASGQDAIIVTRNGWVICIDPAALQRRWERRLGGHIAATPAAGLGMIVVATDDGTVFGLSAEDGAVRWSEPTLGEMTLQPTLVGETVIVTAESTLHSLHLVDGARGPTTVNSDVWVTQPVLVDGKLLVGDQSGKVSVLDADTLELRYLLRDATGSVPTAPGVDARGRALLAFDDQKVQGHDHLPQ